MPVRDDAPRLDPGADTPGAVVRALPGELATSRLASACSRLKLRRCETVGERPIVLGRVFVHGGGHVRIGHRVVIDGRTAPVELRAHPGALIRLGDGVRIGPGASVEALGEIAIDDGAELGPFCKVLDSHFHPLRGNRRQLMPPTPVLVEAGAVVGERAILLPGAHVAKGTQVPPGAVVSRRGRPSGVTVSRAAPVTHVPKGRFVYWAQLAAQGALAWWLFGRAALGKRVFATGRIRVENEGELQLDEWVQFLGGMIPSRIGVRPHARLHIGYGTILNYGVTIEASRSISVGRLCMLASFVRIADSEDGRVARPVTIGNEVWLAHGAVVRPGVTIGDGSVVGAGSVVERDVPPEHLAMGNPARCMPLRLLYRDER